jgi:hypothetical protein
MESSRPTDSLTVGNKPDFVKFNRESDPHRFEATARNYASAKQEGKQFHRWFHRWQGAPENDSRTGAYLWAAGGIGLARLSGERLGRPVLAPHAVAAVGSDARRRHPDGGPRGCPPGQSG